MRRADNLTTFICRLSWNLRAWTSWNPQDLSRPVQGLLDLLPWRWNGRRMKSRLALHNYSWTLSQLALYTSWCPDTDFRFFVNRLRVLCCVCLPMTMSELGIRRTDVNESCYERYGIADFKYVHLYFLQSVIAPWRGHKLLRRNM